MIQFTVTTEKLKSALNCAPKNDARFYLNGVHIEATPEHCYIVSTDGSCMYLCHDLGAVLPSEPVSLILPRDKVEMIVKIKVKHTTLTIHDDGSIEACGMRFKPVDGRFPDWRRVIPRPESVDVDGRAAQFSPDILSRCAKALGGTPVLRYDKQDDSCPAVMTGNLPKTEVCVIMPLRVKPEQVLNWKSQW